MFSISELVKKFTSSAESSSPAGSSNDKTSVFGNLPPELVDQIIDHLHDDKPTLKALALASRLTLLRSRIHLISHIKFANTDERFNYFLMLVDRPWTSFSAAVESMHIKKMFHLSSHYRCLRPTVNLERIIANLPHLKTLRLERITWPSVGLPAYIPQLFLQLPITHLQLDDVTYRAADFVDFFSKIPPSLKTMTLYDLRIPEGTLPDQSHIPTAFGRSFHLKHLDTISLFLFQNVWDPKTIQGLDVKVDSFILRLCYVHNTKRPVNMPVLSRFLNKVGPSLSHLYINISDDFCDLHALPTYWTVDLSQCCNLRMIHIGTIKLDLKSKGGLHIQPTLSAMWDTLNNIVAAKPVLEEIVFLFQPVGANLDDTQGRLFEVENFDWLDLVARLQEMFAHLKYINIALGYYDFQNIEEKMLHKALGRATGVRQLTEKGVVRFHTLPWHTTSSPDITWRHVPTSISTIGLEMYNFNRHESGFDKARNVKL